MSCITKYSKQRWRLPSPVRKPRGKFCQYKNFRVSQWTFFCSSRCPVTSTDVSFIMALCWGKCFLGFGWIFLQNWKRSWLTLRYCTLMGLADGLLIASSRRALFCSGKVFFCFFFWRIGATYCLSWLRLKLCLNLTWWVSWQHEPTTLYL